MTSLAGRDSERDMLAGLLEDVNQRGAALVVLGDPGIGKSALLADTSNAAASQGMLVLKMSGVQSEANLPFAGLHQLLRPVMTLLDDLPPRQQSALGAAFGLDDSPAPEPFLIALATLRLLGEAATRAPVLVVAEDAHWIDRPSVDVLAFVARRVDSDPIVVLMALRGGYDSPLLNAGLPCLRLGPLLDEHARDLLDARFPELARAIRDQVLAEAEGNPLALLELPAALHSSNWSETGLASGGLPLTERLEQAFASRLRDLPRITQMLMLVAAADDRSCLAQVMSATETAFSDGTVAADLAGVVPVVSDLIPAVEAGLIAVGEQTVRFRHPLVRSAIYQAANAVERRTAHAALAEVLADDPDRRVWHRAATAVGPDPEIAAELGEAARRAGRRGAVLTAAAAFERAASITADLARRGTLLLSTAEAARELGRPDMVRRLLREASTCPLSEHDQAQALWLEDGLADVPPGDLTRVHALTAAARHMAAEKHSRLALNLLSAAANRCYVADMGPTIEGEILDAADHVGAPPDDPLLLHIQSYAAPIARGPAVLGHLARMAPPDDPESLYLLGTAACQARDFHLSCSLLGTSAATLREQGRLRALTRVLTTQAWSAIMIADFPLAAPAAEEAQRLAAETGLPLWQAGAQTAQAVLAAICGEHATVEALTAQIEESVPTVGTAELLSLVQYARGLLALGQGRHAEAYAQLRRIYEPGDPAHDHRNLCTLVGDLAEAAARSGHQRHASKVLDQLRPIRQQAPWFRVAIPYAEALLASDENAEAAFQDAFTGDLRPWPFWRARLQLAHGEWLRRQRRISDSRVSLRAAEDVFDALGAEPWSERARRELRASGESTRRRVPSAINQLTPQELQIIQLAAEGLSNREIGQRLYLSHRTVESHLYHVFPKLGIASRSELKNVVGVVVRAAI